MTNRHHLPAGQSILGGSVMSLDANTHTSAGSRRRQPQPQSQYMPQYQHNNYAMPQHNYATPQPYYGMQHQFQSGGMPSPGYMPYQSYGRSPSQMHQYVPMVGVSIPSNFTRHIQHSPSLSTPYQPPQANYPAAPHTPSSTHSSQLPPPLTPPTPQTLQVVTPISTASAQPVLPKSGVTTPINRASFRPPLPWLSCADAEFPLRTTRLRKSRQQVDRRSNAVYLPRVQQDAVNSCQQRVEEQTLHAYASDSAASDGTPTDSAEPNTNEPKSLEAPSVERLQILEQPAEPIPAPRPPPISWANLFAKTPVAAVVNVEDENDACKATNGAADVDGDNSTVALTLKANAISVAEAIRSYKVGGTETRRAFLEPRGLINTGNMCYMNSVLQVLMFCSPFYDFLDQISKRAAHSFNSETPLLDAMIMFMRDYKVLKSPPSNGQLRRTSQGQENDHNGEPFTPDFVYEAIRKLSRFASMRRGHQQDAEEFLGFLLQSLNDECTHVMNLSQTAIEEGAEDAASSDGSVNSAGDWQEVGRKQRAALTRSSECSTSTPITKIFGGLLRSEFRVPGLKDSITTEPYQPLQLDIGSPEVRNVVDALRGLTRPERMQGDFNSPRGKDVSATKQVFIETLPPVLILHLKRFQFDAEGGITKVWKHVGYPHDLEIPREVLSRQARQGLSDSALPKYKLVSVVYHHGKNASGGHYTADVLRHDGCEWLRLDDTVLRRLRNDEVADCGSEEVKDAHNDNDRAKINNRFGAINGVEAGNGDGWNRVTASTGSGAKRWSNVVSGSNGNSRDHYAKKGVKDKVAYLLFYQRV